MWALRHGLSEGLRASGPVVGFRPSSFRRRDLASFRREAMLMLEADFPDFRPGRLRSRGRRRGALQPGRSLPGRFGPVRFARKVDQKELPIDRKAALREAVLSLAVDGFGASFSGEHGLGPAFQDAYDRVHAEAGPGLFGRRGGGVRHGLGGGSAGTAEGQLSYEPSSPTEVPSFLHPTP